MKNYKIITSINQKGGVGKSASLVFLSKYLTFTKKKNVLIIDTDFKQKTIYTKAAKNNLIDKNGNTPIGSILNISIEEALKLIHNDQKQEALNEYDYILIDFVGSFIKETMTDFLVLSDVISIPTYYGESDLDSTLSFLSLINKIQKLKTKKGYQVSENFVFFNKIKNTNINEYKEVRKTLSKYIKTELEHINFEELILKDRTSLMKFDNDFTMTFEKLKKIDSVGHKELTNFLSLIFKTKIK